MEAETINQISGLIETIRPMDNPPKQAINQKNLIERQEGSVKVNQSQNTSDKKYGRNDKVVVTKEGEEKEIKFKKIDEYLQDGWVIKE